MFLVLFSKLKYTETTICTKYVLFVSFKNVNENVQTLNN